MKIALLHAVAGESCKRLAYVLREHGHKVDIFKPFEDGKQNFHTYDAVFAYGYSGYTEHKHRINKGVAVKTCVNKAMTFSVFDKHKIPTVRWTTKFHEGVKEWDQVCVRDSLTGRKAEGMRWFLQGEKIPTDAALYTETHYGRYEYRVVCFMGKVVGIYYKKNIEGFHHFMKQPMKGFEQLIKDAERASKALGIDYVGYDVIAHNKRSYAFLEANSGAMLTDEGEQAIINYFSKG